MDIVARDTTAKSPPSASAEWVGRTIRAARLARGWSQAELAKRSGLGQANVSHAETARSDIRLSTLLSIARCLDLEVVLAPRDRSVSLGHLPALPSVHDALIVPDPVDDEDD